MIQTPRTSNLLLTDNNETEKSFKTLTSKIRDLHYKTFYGCN